ncbi:MAG: hypothetical protein AB1345_01045 [Chloroflexota bacterium]
MTEEISEVTTGEGKSKTWVIVLVVVLAVLFICCLCILLIAFGIPAILGPAVGEVFSNIIQELGTPIP